MISQAEENYLKAIYKINEREGKSANTNAISAAMNTTAASVTDMLKRLADKDFIHYEKYKGVTLTTEGSRTATALVRKHRIWEVFLCDKLGYSWDECHDLAEQLEHIQSPDLIDRLDTFLGKPKFDPHGDPIPDRDGNYAKRQQVRLDEMLIGDRGVMVGVHEHSSAFLQHLDRVGLVLAVQVEVLEVFDFDKSVKIRLNGLQELLISNKVSENVFIKIA
ncbi:MAG: metal-dependent transcriptional regulator [Saprospiraceae bacterium]|nr:metal-dependent transcriptional regulator [Saprospiraceae bacterium]